MSLRFVVAFVVLVAPVAAFAGVVSGSGPCRPEFVVPYADQCTFDYHGISKDRSPQNLQAAFGACDRAQSASLACVSSPTRQIHVVALDALYASVSAQSEIALFAGQYAVAESLLREKLTVIGAIGHEAQHGDAGLDAARASTQSDLTDAIAGQCTWKALSAAGKQQALVRAHAWGDLATLLAKKADAYAACSRIPSTPAHRAYVEYLGYVAQEEGGRAAQAAGQQDAANDRYRSCIDGTARSSAYATHNVRSLLATVGALCRGRLSGKFGVNVPQPMDADDGKHFRPLTVPTG